MTHPDDCLCPSCLEADFNAHVIKTFGQATLDRVMAKTYDMYGVGSVRTRYAKPGQSLGHGKRVRKVSEKQVRFMRHLFATRDTSKLTRLPGSEDIENMSLRGARDLIECLLECPELPGTPTEPMATEKQVAFAASLATRKGRDVGDLSAYTRREISALIEELKATPDEVPELEQGMYRRDDVIYKVQRAVHGSGNLYAKQLVMDDEGAHFEYAPGMVHKLTADDKLTLDEAKEFGALYGVCCACSKTLTDEESISKGIGPVCERKHFS